MDRANRTIGFKFYSEAGAELMKTYNPEVYKLFTRYCDGVNAAIANMIATKQLRWNTAC